MDKRRLIGHTIDEFLTIKEKPWRPIDGFVRAFKSNGVRPWTIPDNFMMIFRASIENCHMISDEFNAEYFSAVVGKIVWALAAATVFYFWTAMLSLIVYGRYLDRKPRIAAVKVRKITSSTYIRSAQSVKKTQ